MPPPGVSALDFYMQRARQVAPASAAPPAPELPKSLDFDERLRLERAIAKTAALIENATVQLKQPELLPSELTPSEAAEEDFFRAKQYSRILTKKLHDHKLQRSQTMLVDVMEGIDEYAALPAPPPPSRIPRPVSIASTSTKGTSRSTSRLPRPASALTSSPSTSSERGSPVLYS
ncbi:hypothetical protein CERZMDRAFT_81384 [Cercospora zeae-maydis SCOH1-5]|uniref:Uncharacterized protein n=1 Tax=Cercospora zeae-maydis SCOH1-5 TaxID=717836 RepID=A0A6A6FS46_9PEZI|nr:hypothetical protein CERZMDRAFT_81384 [Cercospora zeae-maydis SCOH1-5]